MPAEVRAERLWVRRIEDREPFDTLAVERRRPPCDKPAPVVPDEAHPVASERIGEGDDVAGEAIERVAPKTLRLVAEVVAALVRRDDAQSGGGEGPELMPPAVPELRKAVQQDRRPALRRARFDDMQVKLADAPTRMRSETDRRP